MPVRQFTILNNSLFLIQLTTIPFGIIQCSAILGTRINVAITQKLEYATKLEPKQNRNQTNQEFLEYHDPKIGNVNENEVIIGSFIQKAINLFVCIYCSIDPLNNISLFSNTSLKHNLPVVLEGQKCYLVDKKLLKMHPNIYSVCYNSGFVF